VVWEWREEWKILADFNAEFKNFVLMREPASSADKLRERVSRAQTAQSLFMSDLLNKARTFFIKKVQN
jgi:hypothetical protein